MCQSSKSRGYHISPGFDTYVRLAAAAPRDPYYAYSEEVKSSLDAMPPKIASLLMEGQGFGHLERMFSMPLAMDYPIFFNNTALLQDFPLYQARVDEELRKDAWKSVSNLTTLFGFRVENTFAAWTVAASLLLMLELYDQVHEIVLGNQPLLPSTEVWDWLHTFQEHPDSYWLYRSMSPENHYLHAILHRIEGHRVGEAGLIGFDNAKFWFAGGVEKPKWGLGPHPVFASLAAAAKSHAPLRKCCIRAEDHSVLVPPGRQVQVAAGWDPFAFVDFHRAVVEGKHPQADDIAALKWAQRFEFELLFNYSLKLAMNSKSDAYLSGTPEEVPVVLEGKTFHLWAQRWGKGPVKILLVHGGPGCSHVVFDSLTSILSPLDYELIFWDQLGGGKSDCSAQSAPCHAEQPASLNDFVDQIEQVRTYMKLPAESTLLLGHSWGVMLTIEYALKYPGRFRGYVLAGFPASLAAQMNRMMVLKDMNVSNFFRSFICRKSPCPQSMLVGSAHCNSDLDARLLWTDGGMSCTGELCSWNRWADLRNITSPSLLMVGDFDIAAPADVRDMADMMPHARFVEFRNSGHAEWIDASAAFTQSLSAWVQEVFTERQELQASQLWHSSAIGGSQGVWAGLLLLGAVSLMSWKRRAVMSKSTPLLTSPA